MPKIPPKSGVLTLKALYRVVLAVNFLAKRGMDANANILNRINSVEAVKHWRSVYCHIADTKISSLDDIQLSKIPKDTALKSTQFYIWYEELILKMEKYKSVDGFTPGGYLLRSADVPMNYISIDWGLYLVDQRKRVAIFNGESRFFTAAQKELSYCGFSWIDKYCATRNVHLYSKDINNYYCIMDNVQEEIG